MFRSICITLSTLAWLALGGLAEAAPITFTATLSGSQEFPPVNSPGSGTATVIFDAEAHTMSVDASFEDLLSPTTASHIHGPVVPPEPNAGVATQVPSFVGFPLGVTAGTYSEVFNTLDPATYNPAFLTANGGTAAGAEAAFLDMLLAGAAYLNIHTEMFPAGEIRGNLTQQVAIPAPAGLALFALALVAFAGLRQGMGQKRA